MPKDSSIRSVLIIGSGPIVIGQACEFDYSGSQASRSLREEGIEVSLINSNPATIMTDNIMADYIYLLPLTAESVIQILEERKIDAVLPTMGGQTALNLAIEIDKMGIWEKYGVKMIGVDVAAIELTENREAFRQHMINIGLSVAPSFIANSFLEGKEAAQKIGFPLVIRPSYTLGGTGGAIIMQEIDFDAALRRGLNASPTHEVLVEKAVLGWKEFELELLRDKNDNVVIICTVENLDPMGIHTGDSITVAPAMTLSDTAYQQMRDEAIQAMRSLGNFSGGCNIQFAQDPITEKLIVIEINPRVSRSSALASKATGYPIAKIASKLALGYHLDELKNQITKTTSAFFEPTLDYVIVKIPRWNNKEWTNIADVLKRMEEVSDDRLFRLKDAMKLGVATQTLQNLTRIDPWFLKQIKRLLKYEISLGKYHTIQDVPASFLRELKEVGYSDLQIARLMHEEEENVRAYRKSLNIRRTFKMVDTCAAEFEAKTPYFYSTFDQENESIPSDKKKVIVLGSGPNRIGQGIEFDYCCVHGLLAIKDAGFESIMVNCNPETVSTDFDIADKLYFEPVFWEHLEEIIELEKPEGIIVQLGGQTALKLAKTFHEKGIPIIGTSYPNMDLAEDRGAFSDLLKKLGIPYPEYGAAKEVDEGIEIAKRVGYPVLVRPSYVLGGQSMRIVINDQELEDQMLHILKNLSGDTILIDHFLDRAKEAEVDAICDGETVHIMGIMEHIEPAGVHSGDSSAVLPTYSLSVEAVTAMVEYTEKLAFALNIKGLINVQFAIKDNKVYVIEANPRASRTTPFIAKAYQVPYLQIATKVMLGTHKLKDFDIKPQPRGFAIKVPVFSFDKFPNVDKNLGPEMKSTGEEIRFIKDLSDPFFRMLNNQRNMYLSR